MLHALQVICYILLSGSPPFYTDNPRLAISPGMKRRIHSADYSFPPGQWRGVSQATHTSPCRHTGTAQAAKDLIKGCLQSEPRDRLTIDEVLDRWPPSAWPEALPPQRLAG
jgi:serine/threonine protein kinase